MSDPLAIPLAVIFMAVMDYAAWQVFVAVADGFAILYMALLIVLELATLAKAVG